ncbi:hypothetical protein VTK56DRAFT_7997 [Thermocarpiscus australiensis]
MKEGTKIISNFPQRNEPPKYALPQIKQMMVLSIFLTPQQPNRPTQSDTPSAAVPADHSLPFFFFSSSLPSLLLLLTLLPSRATRTRPLSRREPTNPPVVLDHHHHPVPVHTVVIMVTMMRMMVMMIQHLPRHLHVIVRELANLGVVDAPHLGLLGRAQAQRQQQALARAADDGSEPVHHEQDGARHRERVGPAREGAGQLDGQLRPVAVEPAGGAPEGDGGGDAVQAGDVGGGEEGGADVADQAADGVHGEDVEGVVDAEEELELGGVVGEARAEDAGGDGGPGGEEAFFFCEGEG